jgi:hypothetical protein
VQQLLLFRALSNVGLRSGIGGALLLGSAGLLVAIPLLLYAATYKEPTVSEEWNASAKSPLTFFQLEHCTSTKAQLSNPASTNSMSASVTDAANYRTHAGSQSWQRPAPTAFQFARVTLDSTSTTLRRSWGTVKAMFR